MSNYNSFEWRNENSLSGYPLVIETPYPALLVDAKFVQFDNFIPILSTVLVDAAKITLSIIFDYGKHTSIELTAAAYASGEASRHVRIYQPDTGRYLGSLTFGTGAGDLWNSALGSLLTLNVLFSAETVLSIPKQDAVYTFDSNYGAVVLGRGENDTTIFYNTARVAGFNSITFNAVGGHSVNTNTIKNVPSPGPQGLRKINLVSPVANNINLVSNDVVKVTPLNAASLSVGLAAGTPTTSFAIPSLAS